VRVFGEILMTPDLLDAAMSLPPEERAELAERLLESLPAETVDAFFANDLAQEVRSRRERNLKDRSSLLNWTDVRAELDEIINQFDQP
jgi:hypothetical protein